MRKRNRFLMDGRLGRTCDERMLPNIKEVIEHYQGDIRYTVEKDIVCAEIVLFHVVMY